jgi:hypothetical protein
MEKKTVIISKVTYNIVVYTRHGHNPIDPAPIVSAAKYK